MDSIPPPPSWFSPEEIKRHAEGVIIGLAAALGLQKLGIVVTGEKAKMQADLAVAQDRLAKALKTIAEQDDEIDEMRREIRRLREPSA